MEKKRILIIDDEASFTRMVRINLEKTGQFEVREENRAGNALGAAREFKPDLILLDVIMPAMDGGDVKAKIKRDPQLCQVPVIFLTATLSPQDTGPRGLTSAGELFLAKPIGTEALIEHINERLKPPEAPPEGA